MNFPEIYSASGMIELIQKIGFLPLLDSGIEGFSAEDIVAEDPYPYVGRRTGTTERKVPFAECRPGATGAYAGAVPGTVGGVRDLSYRCAGKGAGVRIVAIAFGFV